MLRIHVWISRGYLIEDIDAIFEKYLNDQCPVHEIYDEMTAALHALAKVCAL